MLVQTADNTAQKKRINASSQKPDANAAAVKPPPGNMKQTGNPHKHIKPAAPSPPVKPAHVKLEKPDKFEYDSDKLPVQKGRIDGVPFVPWDAPNKGANGRWIHKPDPCEKTTGGFPKKGVKGHGGECVFPFWYKGIFHDGCTMEDHHHYWCATSETFKNDGFWGHCTPECTKDTVNHWEAEVAEAALVEVEDYNEEEEEYMI